jgi:hypothetical protein
MWIAISCVASALVALGCLIATYFVAQSAKADAGLPQAKLHFIESQLQLLQRSQNDQAEVLTELSNRVKMMKVRNSLRHGENSTGLPDPYRDPDGWRKAMDKRIASTRFTGGS